MCISLPFSLKLARDENACRGNGQRLVGDTSVYGVSTIASRGDGLMTGGQRMGLVYVPVERGNLCGDHRVGEAHR